MIGLLVLAEEPDGLLENLTMMRILAEEPEELTEDLEVMLMKDSKGEFWIHCLVESVS